MMDDMALRVIADTASILDKAALLKEMIKNVRKGHVGEIDDLDPFGLHIYCEFADELLEHVIDHLASCGVGVAFGEAECEVCSGDDNAKAGCLSRYVYGKACRK